MKWTNGSHATSSLALPFLSLQGWRCRFFLGALRSVKHDTLSKKKSEMVGDFVLDWNLQLYIFFYIHKCIYIYTYIYIYVCYFRLSLGWTRTAGRKSLSFHWQITRMVKFPASYVSSLEATSLKINMSPEKGTISKRVQSSSNHYFWGAAMTAMLIFLGVSFLLAIFCSSLDGHGPRALAMWHDIETTTKPPQRFPELWEVFKA